MRAVLLAAVAAAAFSATAMAQTFTFTTLDNPGDPTFNQLLGINDNGVIVGYFGSGVAGHPNIGYEIAPPYTAYTQNMQPGSVQTQATGINNAGLTTGFWSDTNNGPGMDANFGFLRSPLGKNFQYTSVIDPLVASLPRIGQALGVNNAYEVGGFYNDANGLSHGFTYAIKTAAYTTIDLKGAVQTAVTGLNDSGETCGFYINSAGRTFGFVRSSDGGSVNRFLVPGTNTTQLLGINNEGIAVGFYFDSANIPHGLYYTPSTGAWVVVNDPNGAMGTVVNGINNKGELVGFYTDAAGNTHGMLVTVQ